MSNRGLVTDCNICDCLSTEKTKNPEQIDVYTVQQKGVRKRVIRTTLGAFWKKDSVIRINNVDDKQETPNSEKDIRAKVTVKHKQNVSNSYFQYRAVGCIF